MHTSGACGAGAERVVHRASVVSSRCRSTTELRDSCNRFRRGLAGPAPPRGLHQAQQPFPPSRVAPHSRTAVMASSHFTVMLADMDTTRISSAARTTSAASVRRLGARRCGSATSAQGGFPDHRVVYLRFCGCARSEYPAALTSALEQVTDGAGVIVDLCGPGPIDFEAGHALRVALRSARARGVDAVVAADREEVRLPLVLAEVDMFAPIRADLSDARHVLDRRIAI